MVLNKNLKKGVICTLDYRQLKKKAKPLEKTFLGFKKWVKSILQTAGYNGARTV